jgi:hypothetical protein
MAIGSYVPLFLFYFLFDLFLFDPNCMVVAWKPFQTIQTHIHGKSKHFIHSHNRKGFEIGKFLLTLEIG